MKSAVSNLRIWQRGSNSAVYCKFKINHYKMKRVREKIMYAIVLAVLVVDNVDYLSDNLVYLKTRTQFNHKERGCDTQLNHVGKRPGTQLLHLCDRRLLHLVAGGGGGC